MALLATLLTELIGAAMRNMSKAIVTVVLVCASWIVGTGVCSAQFYGYSIYADVAWSEGVVYGVAEGYDYATAPVSHCCQTLSSGLYSPGGRVSSGSTDTALSFSGDFGTWGIDADYGFNCSADGWIQVGTNDSLDLNDPSPMADAGLLQACLEACAGGTEEVYEFCRGLPNPAWKAACWGIALLGEVACSNWCYWKFS